MTRYVQLSILNQNAPFNKCIKINIYRRCQARTANGYIVHYTVEGSGTHNNHPLSIVCVSTEHLPPTESRVIFPIGLVGVVDSSWKYVRRIDRMIIS